jgi:hypothetical protein
LHFTYQKTVEEVKDKAKIKAEAVRAKILEREGRIRDLRKAHDISDQDLIQIYSQAARNGVTNSSAPMSYTVSTVAKGRSAEGTTSEPDEWLIGAGVIQNLLSESGLIETEKEDLKKLESINRNLRPTVNFSADTGVSYVDQFVSLTEDDLEYLGF